MAQPVSVALELTPEQIAEIRTGHARRAFVAGFARAVDPAAQLNDEERDRLARIALVEHMRVLGRSSAQARRAKNVVGSDA